MFGLALCVFAGVQAPMAWEEPITVAEGGGRRGPWRMNDSDYDYVDDGTVAFGDDGTLAVAWVDQARKDVRLQIWGVDGRPRLAAPIDVSRSPATFSWLPRVVLSGDQVAVLWQEIVFSGGSHGGEIFVATSRDGGRSFGEPRNLSRSKAGDGKGRLDPRRWDNGSLDLARGAGGRLVAAWTEYEGALWVARSDDFASPTRVPGPRPARAPSLAIAPSGDVILAWAVGDDPTAPIHVAWSRDGGRSFTAPVRVGGAGGHADAPRLVVDPSGAVHLVYAERAMGSASYRLRHARAPAGETRFGPAADIPTGAAGAHFPALGVDGAGQLFVLWEVVPDPELRPLGLGLARSRDGGRTFGPAAIVPRTADPALGWNGSQQGLLTRKLAVGPSGAVAVVHSTFRAGEGSRVWLIRGSGSRPAPRSSP